MNCKAAARIHDYDTRLVPWDSLKPVLEEAAQLAQETAQLVTGWRWTEAQTARARLPGCLGGLGLRLLDREEMAAAAHLATWQHHAREVPRLAKQAGLAIGQLAGKEEAERCKAKLQAMGVSVDTDGAARFDEERKKVWQSSPWAEDRQADDLAKEENWEQEQATSEDTTRPRRVLGRIWRHIEALDAARVQTQLDTDEADIALDCGGQGAGGIWASAMQGGGLEKEDIAPVWFDDSHVWAATQARMVALRPKPGETCQLRTAGTDHQCGKPLGTKAQHLWSCSIGPARQRAHKHLELAVQKMCTSSGAHVDLERPVPSLAKVTAGGDIEEAVLDDVVAWPGIPRSFCLDVTVRQPAAKRYAKGGGIEPALNAAAQEKLKRYGPLVQCIAVGAFGRIAKATQEHLGVLACTAAASGGGAEQASQLLKQWKPYLQKVVIWSQADVIILATGGKVASTQWHLLASAAKRAHSSASMSSAA